MYQRSYWNTNSGNYNWTANYIGDMVELPSKKTIVMCESAPHEEHYFDYSDSDYSDYSDCDPCNGGRS